MAKGKITPYNADSFSPSAVGTPGVDKSGQILAQGAEGLAQALIQREDTSNTLAATVKFGDFQVDYATKKLELQKQFRDNPNEFPAAAKAMSEKLADQYSQNMPEGIHKKFRSFTASALAQDGDNLVNWANKRDNEIQIGNVITIKQNVALEAQTVDSAESLKGILFKFQDASTLARKVISPEADTELTTRYAKLAKENAMMSQIYAQPVKVLRDLEGGTYKGILEPDEIASYSNKARTAIYNKANDDFYRGLFVSQGEIYDLQKQVDDGSISPAELIARKQAAWANKDAKDANGNKVFSDSYFKALDNLTAQVLHTGMTLPAEQAEQRKTVLAAFDSNWEQYLTAKKEDGGQPNPKDVEKELEMYANLSDLYGKGVINKADFDAKVDVMQTKLALRVGKTAVVKSFSQALEEAGKSRWFRDTSNDVFVYGYQYIKEHIDKAYSTLDPTSKQELKAQMLSQYTKQIKAFPEGTLKGLTTEVAKRSFAHDVVVGHAVEGKEVPGILPKFSFYQDPASGKPLFYGDTLTQNGATKRFLGMDPETGAPKWKYVEGSIVTTAKGRFKALSDGTFERL